MVVMKDGVNESSEKRKRQQDLPTPESPIRRSLIYDAVLVYAIVASHGQNWGGGSCQAAV